MIYDIAIIGGGINGCGIAREASISGASVFLCEKGDLGGATSSASTKLIHGGLRYLEYYEFRLVREALAEREILWKMAPHIIRPSRFVLPYINGMRPAWLLRLGLFIYDYIGGRKLLPPTRRISLKDSIYGKPLKPDSFNFAFEYSDCKVDDARLVILNARDAADNGAIIQTQSEATSIKQADDHWIIEVRDNISGDINEIKAKVLINAAGPWVSDVIERYKNQTKNPSAKKIGIRLVQGSHIVVPKLFDHDKCYIFQNEDNRIIFAIPYCNDYTLIGTTDRDYHGNPAEVTITKEETEYLCAAASKYFKQPVLAETIVWTYSGVRPLVDDGATAAQSATRDYVFDLNVQNGLPFLSIFGGKITTYRKLALHALHNLKSYLPENFCKDLGLVKNLPGGDFAAGEFDKEVENICALKKWIGRDYVERLYSAYGTKITEIICDACSYEDLGVDFGFGLYAAEVDYLIKQEWVRSVDDILWRRTKFGLRFDAKQIANLTDYIADKLLKEKLM